MEYLNIVSQVECSHQPEKFVCHVQHCLSAVTYLRLIAALFFTNSFRWKTVNNVVK